MPFCAGGTLLPDPSASDQLFPEHVTECLFPQASHTSQGMPNPNLPYLEPSQVLKSGQMPPVWSTLGTKNTSCTWQATSGCFKTLGPLATSLHPISCGCCPWLFRGMRMTSSALLLQKAFPWSGCCYPAKKAWQPQAPTVADVSHVLRGLHLFAEGWSRICIHQMDFEYGPTGSCFCSRAPLAASSMPRSFSLSPSNSTSSLGTSSQMSLRCPQAALRPDLSVGDMGEIFFYPACDCCIVGWWWCAKGVMRAPSAPLPTTAPTAPPVPL